MIYVHVKTRSMISVSTWRLVSDESCRYILLYVILAYQGHLMTRHHGQTRQKNPTLAGLRVLGYSGTYLPFYSELGYFEFYV